MTQENSIAPRRRLEDIQPKEVSVVDRGANGETFFLVKREGDNMDEVTKSEDTSRVFESLKKQFIEKASEGSAEIDDAVWSTAYVNTFPDSSFLYIKPGGTKDDEGKTTPRSLRMFPIKDENGKVDLPHLRNAIARIPQANIPGDVKERLQAEARRMLESQNKSEEPVADACGSKDDEKKSEQPVSEQKATEEKSNDATVEAVAEDKACGDKPEEKAVIVCPACGAPVPLPEGKPETEDEEMNKTEVEKVGRKISRARFEKLTKTIGALDGVMKSLADMQAEFKSLVDDLTASVEAAADSEAPVAKDATSEPVHDSTPPVVTAPQTATIEKKDLVDLKEVLVASNTRLENLEKRIERFELSRATSRSEGVTATTKLEKRANDPASFVGVLGLNEIRKRVQE